MQYSYYEKNHGKDSIYYTRLRLIEKMGININKSAKMYSYYMDAYLGIILQQENIMIFYKGKWYTKQGEITITEKDKLFTTFSNGEKHLSCEIENKVKNQSTKVSEIKNRIQLEQWKII